METIEWFFLIFFIVIVLVGLKDWFFFFLNSWSENGGKFTLILLVLFFLFVSPAFVKDYAPEYYGLSIWILILYVGGLLVYRFMFWNGDSE